MSELLMTRYATLPSADRSPPSPGGLLVQIFPIDGPEEPIELGADAVTIGRDTACDLTLADDAVSRRHATIEPRGQRHQLTDLGSTNGTYVNDERLSVPRVLLDGDRIRFGHQIFKYLAGDKAEAQYHELVFRLMTTDGLTGVANKRYLMEILDRDWEQAVHEGSSLALLMMDLDKFKSINDTHGHPAGDAVLVEFARRARSVVRSTDLLARFGGEEFSVLMTHADLAEASEVAERIREAVAARPILFEGTSIPVTVSIGLAVALPKGNARPADLIAQADALLYEAKQAGRNRVCFGPVA